MSICATLFGSWFINDMNGQIQQELVHQVEELVSLYSLNMLSDEDFSNLQTTLNQDKEALNKVVNMIQEFKRNEEKKIDISTYQGKKGKISNKDVDGIIDYIYDSLQNITKNTIGGK